MQKILLAVGICFAMITLRAQDKKTSPLLKTFPVSFTPLSFWNSDISTSAGVEYRFHHSFSTRTAADYIYGNYGVADHSRTSGVRLRQEFRYYIAGNRIMNSRSKAWPYIAVVGGVKRVTTTIKEWRRFEGEGASYAEWISNKAVNREWFIQGKAGMQTAFGREKRFLFDLGLGLGTSNNRVKNGRIISYNDPLFFPVTFESSSDNLRSGKFVSVNFEACFGYRF